MKIIPCDTADCGGEAVLDALVPKLGARSKSQYRFICKSCGSTTGWHTNRDKGRAIRAAGKEWNSINAIS